MKRFLVSAAQWVTLALLAVAPWALACQPPRTWLPLEATIGLAVALRLSAVAAGARPRVPPLLLGLSVALLGYGWATATGGVPAGPDHAAAAAAARADMQLVTACVLTGWLACDLAHDARWRGRAWATLVGTAALLAAVGTAGRLHLVDPFGRFMDPQGHEGTPFGPFNYHANAGAFLNLVLPLAVLMCDRPTNRVAVTAGGATALILVGVAVNVSRGAQAVTAVELVACTAVRWASRSSTTPDPRSRKRPDSEPVAGSGWATTLGPLLIGLVIVVIAIGSRQAVRRWSQLSSAVQSDSSRPLLWRVCWGMARSAGWRGDGPGTFKVRFPHSSSMLPELYSHFIVQEYTPGTRVPMWNHVHDDYLQTLIEWGWPGTALWVAVFAGGLTAAARAARRRSAAGRPFDARLAAALVIGLGGTLLHAVIDFPLQVEVIRLYAAVMLGMAWSAPRWGAAPVPSPGIPVEG